MPEKDPSTYAWITYAWVIGLASLGGITRRLRQTCRRDSRVWCVMEFIGEILSSILAGLITFYLCEHFDIGGGLQAALVAISGHMGGRALTHFEAILKRKAKQAGLTDETIIGKETDQ